MNKRKKVECPNCNSRLMDEDIDSITIVDINKKNKQGDYYPKCPVCKKELVIKKIK